MPGPSETTLLHRHGRPARWGNLGLWPAADYADAAEALARRVGEAARLAPGQRVLSLASGGGEELALWRSAFGVAEALGSARGTGAWPQGSFDAVLCVDAAYHFSPRADWLAAAHARLRPGGWFAFTDLVIDTVPARPPGAPLRLAARLCGVAAEELGAPALRLQQLARLGFDAIGHQDLGAAVLDGFAAFERAQGQRLGRAAWQPGWWRVRTTARLIPPCRRAGLGYALFWARRP